MSNDCTQTLHLARNNANALASTLRQTAATHVTCSQLQNSADYSRSLIQVCKVESGWQKIRSPTKNVRHTRAHARQPLVALIWWKLLSDMYYVPRPPFRPAHSAKRARSYTIIGNHLGPLGGCFTANAFMAKRYSTFSSTASTVHSVPNGSIWQRL